MRKETTSKTDLADTFNIAAWQNDVRVINRMARQHPWLVSSRKHYLLEALHTACNAGQERSAKVLVEKYGADVNKMQSAERGMSPLHEAMNSHDNTIARLLIRHGADVNAKVTSKDGFVDGWTPLHFAVSSGDENIIRYLVRHGADASIRNDKGETPTEMGRADGHDKRVAAADFLDRITAPKAKAAKPPQP